MDTFLLQKYYSQFQNRSIRLDPYLINKIGIYKDQSILKIEEYYINCIPFELSLCTCKAIVIFKADEIDFFDNFKSKSHPMHLKFLNPLFHREIALFLKSKIKHVEVLNKARNQALIELDFTAPANDFIEIMVDLFLQMDKIDSYLKNPACSEAIVEGSQLKDLYMDDHVFARWGENEEKRSAKIIYTSMKEVKILVELQDLKWLKKQKSHHLDFKKGATVFSVAGKVSNTEALEMVSDYYFVTMELKESFSLCDALVGALNPPSAPEVSA